MNSPLNPVIGIGDFQTYISDVFTSVFDEEPEVQPMEEYEILELYGERSLEAMVIDSNDDLNPTTPYDSLRGFLEGPQEVQMAETALIESITSEGELKMAAALYIDQSRTPSVNLDEDEFEAYGVILNIIFEEYGNGLKAASRYFDPESLNKKGIEFEEKQK